LSDSQSHVPAPAQIRIRSLALAGQAFSWGSIVAFGAAVIWSCVDLGRFSKLIGAMLPNIPVTVDARMWLLSALTIGVMFCLFAWVIAEVANLFRLFGRGDFFGRGVEKGLHRLSYSLMTGALGSVFGRMLLGFILTSNNPQQERQLSISVSSSDLVALLASILFLLFARIVAEARMAVDENQSFV
jgi:hypothetical protein